MPAGKPPSTWRSEVKLYEGMAAGPYYVEKAKDGVWWVLFDGDRQEVGFNTKDEAVAAMHQLAESYVYEPDGFVYFIGYELREGARVKIGYSDDPAKRVRQLQYHSPVDLQIWTATPGDKFSEMQWHYRHRHARAYGEWFTITPELLAEIESVKAEAAAKIW